MIDRYAVSLFCPLHLERADARNERTVVVNFIYSAGVAVGAATVLLYQQKRNHSFASTASVLPSSTMLSRVSINRESISTIYWSTFITPSYSPIVGAVAIISFIRAV